MAAARIGRIRLKSGGAEVRLIRQETPDPGDENWRGKIIEAARAISGFDEPGSELVGYVVVGLFSDGACSTGWRYDAKRSPIPRALMPAYVAEIIRRDVVTHVEAVETVNRANGWETDQ